MSSSWKFELDGINYQGYTEDLDNGWIRHHMLFYPGNGGAGCFYSYKWDNEGCDHDGVCHCITWGNNPQWMQAMIDVEPDFSDVKFEEHPMGAPA